MTDIRFLPGLRRVLDSKFAAPWMSKAACAGVMQRSHTPGQVWSKAYKDDLAAIPPDQEYVFPAAVIDVMKVCAGCPVRRECTAYAYEEVDRVEIQESPEEAAYHGGTPRGQWVDSDRRFGVFGGIPGRQRERLAETTCTDCNGSGVLPDFGEHPEIARGLWPELSGLPCRRCQRPGSGFPWFRPDPSGTGLVPDPDRVENSLRWFENFARDRGWMLANERQEVSA